MLEGHAAPSGYAITSRLIFFRPCDTVHVCMRVLVLASSRVAQKVQHKSQSSPGVSSISLKIQERDCRPSYTEQKKRVNITLHASQIETM